MRKLTLTIYLCAMAGLAFPQDAIRSAKPEADSSPTVTRIVRVRYANPHKLHLLVQDEPGVQIRDDNEMKILILKGGAAQVLAVEHSIHELDVPSAEEKATKSKDVEVIVSVISGSSNSVSLGGPISDDLAPAVRQLRAVFPYKNYQTLGSMLLRSREGAHAENTGVMMNPGHVESDAAHPSVYRIYYGNAAVSSEESKPLIRLSNFEFKMTVPFVTGDRTANTVQYREVIIATDVDLSEGQKVVVGKANMENSDTALFVVLTARLVE